VHVLAICRRLGLQVPEHIAVLGADDDELTAMPALPPLSSIQPPLHQIGAEAVALVRQMIEHPQHAERSVLLPPTGVITRQSSDLTALGDPDVAAAMKFIRAHAEEPIGVEDVLRVVLVSRRALEQRFARILGRSPHQEIRRVRLELARHHLLTSDLKLHDVAQRCGFLDLGNFSHAFHAHTGYTPAAFRKAFRQQNP